VSAGTAMGPGAMAPAKLSSIHWGKIFSYGWMLLRACRTVVFLYIVVYLVNGMLPRYTAKLFGTLTSQLGSIAADRRPAPAGEGANALPADANAVGGPPPATEKTRAVVWTYGAWLILSVGLVGITILFRIINSRLDGMMANRLRTQLFERMIGQSPEFFHTNDPGKLTMILNQLSVEAQLTMRSVMLEPVLQMLLLGFTAYLLSDSFTAVAGQQDPGMMKWVLMGLALLAPALVATAGKNLQASSSAIRDQNLALSGFVNGAFQSPEEIQAMEAERLFSHKHQEGLFNFLRARMRQAFTVEVINTLNSLPALLVNVVFLGYAVYLACTSPGEPNVGAIVSIVLLAPQFISPIQALSANLVMVQTAWPSIETVIGMIEAQSSVKDAPGAQDVLEIAPTLEARDLIFAYRPELAPVFSGLSFQVPPGKVTGFVARMGQGKTTFFRLALRFYQAQQGDIFLGGRSVAEFTLRSLRRNVAMMSQFPAFFNDTLRENMRIAKPDATDEEIRSICERTGVWEILVQRIGPNPLSEQFSGGRKLSGGQRKLLALTRCLLRNPTFLLLDEPTAGMDNVEKHELLPTLREACHGKTVMVIDHDIAWLLKFCDHFIVLDEGRVREFGTPEELLEKDGLLKELYSREGTQ
jgi:ATP-binding cassette subfamily B protein